jgi:hypothetical protein
MTTKHSLEVLQDRLERASNVAFGKVASSIQNGDVTRIIKETGAVSLRTQCKLPVIVKGREDKVEVVVVLKVIEGVCYE